MNSRNPIKDELNELNSELNSGFNPTPYILPSGYFDGLADSIMARIRAGEAATARDEIVALSPMLAGITRSMPYELPAGYFELTIETLPAFTSGEDSLVLSFVDKQMPYEVPAGYFANLPQQVVDKISEPKARVIPLIRRKWMRLAVAAMITGLVALGGILYLNRSNEVPVDSPKWVAKELKNVSDKEIEEFVKTTAPAATGTETALQKPAAKKEIRQLFDDVSDQELEAFLEEIPVIDVEEELGLN